MPSESETLWYLSDKPVTELDQVDELNILRTWSQENGLGSADFWERYMSEVSFFQSEQPNYKTIWMVLCEILFSLNRPHDQQGGFGNGDVTNFWWYKHRADDESYLVYDEEDIKYGWVLYLDIESAPGVTELVVGQVALFNGEAVFRKDIPMIFKGEGPDGGGTEEQTAFQPAGIEVDKPTTPIDIPLFPKWSDKIKEKFHRSDNKDMSNWDKSLNNWQKEFQIALAS
jgi:hypothetical protein